MKVRQTLKQTLLIQEVIEELSSRFKPKISQITVNHLSFKIKPKRNISFFLL
jgi:hypothetical protein